MNDEQMKVRAIATALKIVAVLVGIALGCQWAAIALLELAK